MTNLAIRVRREILAGVKLVLVVLAAEAALAVVEEMAATEAGITEEMIKYSRWQDYGGTASF
mgnify:CR=1 FL=1